MTDAQIEQMRQQLLDAAEILHRVSSMVPASIGIGLKGDADRCRQAATPARQPA